MNEMNIEIIFFKLNKYESINSSPNYDFIVRLSVGVHLSDVMDFFCEFSLLNKFGIKLLRVVTKQQITSY